MFVSRIRSDSSMDRSPYGDFWFTPVGSLSATGQRVTADNALRLSAVYACVRVLTESFAVLPFKLYRPKIGGGRTKVTDHWAFRLFAKRPNQYQNRFEFHEMLQGHLALRGNAFCEIIDDGIGGIAQLIPRHPDRIVVDMLDNGSWRYIYTAPNGSKTIFRRDQIWHIRGLSGDGIVGMSPIELARESIAAGLSAQEYGNRFFANDAKPTGGWLEFPGKFADKNARENFTESMRAAISGKNRHKILTLDQGMKYHEVGATNKDSQFLESRGYSRSEIAGIFRVAPHMIGDLSRATFSNIEQQAIDHWQNTMLPWCERWEAAVESLIDDDTLEVEYDFRNLMRGDASSRSAYAHDGVLDGWLTRNEARELEGYDPIDGLDEPLVPTNEQTLTESEEPPEPIQPPGVGQPAKEQPEQAARLAAVLDENALRMARRVVGGKAPAADVLARALAIAEPIAKTWLELDKSACSEDELKASLLDLALKGTS
jgi:HK97 family phage portal protein